MQTTFNTLDLHRALLVAEDHPEGGEQLQHIVKMLEDRLNYGLFLDQFTTILLLDTCLDRGRLMEGARVASHIMLQVGDTTYDITAVIMSCHDYTAGGGQIRAWASYGQPRNVEIRQGMSSYSAVFTYSVIGIFREAETCRGILTAKSL